MSSPGAGFLQGLLGGFQSGAGFRADRDERRRQAARDEEERRQREEERKRQAAADERAQYWEAMKRADFQEQSGLSMAPSTAPNYLQRWDEQAQGLRRGVGQGLMGPAPTTDQWIPGGIVRGESAADREQAEGARIAASVGAAMTRRAGVQDAYSPQEQTLIGMGKLPLRETSGVEYYRSKYPELRAAPPEEVLRLGRLYEQDALIRGRERATGGSGDIGRQRFAADQKYQDAIGRALLALRRYNGDERKALAELAVAYPELGVGIRARAVQAARNQLAGADKAALQVPLSDESATSSGEPTTGVLDVSQEDYDDLVSAYGLAYVRQHYRLKD